MAAIYAIWKRLGQVRLDGVSYDIGAKEREDGRIFVTWVCMECCEQGPPAPAVGSLEQAIAFAKISLRAHHALFHHKIQVAPSTCIERPMCREHDSDRKPLQSRYVAYAYAKSTFEELRRAFERLQECSAEANRRQRSCGTDASLIRACRDWDEIARQFNQALDVFSRDVNARAEELRKSGSEEEVA
jgi:hypothetical protein